jgi:ankyrin repeat protein
MDALTMDCSYEHYDFIFKASGLDVMSFYDLIVRNALNYGNFNMLLWLQKNTSIGLHAIEDEDGNKLLHQIASRERASEFFRCDIVRQQDRLYDPNSEVFTAKNKDGETWFDILLRTGNLRALEAVLSPSCEWRNGFFLFRRILRQSVKKVKRVAETKRLYSVMKMLDEFNLFQFFSYIALELPELDRDDREEEILRAVRRISESDEDDSSVGSMGHDAIQFIAFLRKRSSSLCCLESLSTILYSLAENGRLRLLKWLVEADEALLRVPSQTRCTTSNRDEFVQPELLKLDDEEYGHIGSEEEIGGLVSAAALGKRQYCSFQQEDAARYLFHLHLRATGFRDTASLVAKLDDSRGNEKDLKKYKITCCVTASLCQID